MMPKRPRPCLTCRQPFTPAANRQLKRCPRCVAKAKADAAEKSAIRAQHRRDRFSGPAFNFSEI